MAKRIGVAAAIVGLFAFAWAGVAAADLRRAVGRPELIEVGEPSLISHDLLRQEMERNVSLREYIELYGWPDYAEIQEVKVPEPLAPYEVRLYYLRRNQELAYSRVFVSPAFPRAGIRTYDGPIPEETIRRLLTAREEVTYTRAVEPAAWSGSEATQPVPASAPPPMAPAGTVPEPIEQPLVIPEG